MMGPNRMLVLNGLRMTPTRSTAASKICLQSAIFSIGFYRINLALIPAIQIGMITLLSKV